MSANRIQKLLFEEYWEFEDMVLLESPFAQTTREGEGIRQVQMGLTPTKLILAVDSMSEARGPLVEAGVDPDTETLELLSLLPVECVNISVFTTRSRQTLKARLSNDRVLYFELAASQKRQMFWNLWCERVKFLCPEEPKSTQSETSVGSSTSDNTIFLKASTVFRWEDRDLWVGGSLMASHSPESSTLQVVNRFGEGIAENCSTSLYLPVAECEEEDHQREEQQNQVEYQKAEEEEMKRSVKKENKEKHRRRYAIATFPHLLYGLGLWGLPKHQAFSLQMKRAYSSMVLNRQSVEFDLDVSKSHLTSSRSVQVLHGNSPHNSFAPSSSPVAFWTPDSKQRLKSPAKIYAGLRNHFAEVRGHLEATRTQLRDGQAGRKRAIHLPWSGKKKKQPVVGNGADLGTGGGGDGDMSLYAPLSTRNFKSVALAYQMTIIERDLFLKITVEDLVTMDIMKNSVYSPNLHTVFAFSHRISNLIASEIVEAPSVKVWEFIPTSS